jgi:hypothetical protein
VIDIIDARCNREDHEDCGVGLLVVLCMNQIQVL